MTTITNLHVEMQNGEIMNNTFQPEGNYYDKYNTTNPIEKKLMSGYFATASDLLLHARNGCRILDAGCGEGNFTHFLRTLFSKSSIDAFDCGKTAIADAVDAYSDDDISFSIGDIYSVPASDGTYDLVTVSEVLEHLESPTEALAELYRVSGKYVFLSVPNEPIWRILNMCRGKYLRDLGNTPGHICHWNMNSLKKMIRRAVGENALIITSSSLPWLFALIIKED